METTYGRGVPPRNALPDRRTSRHACDHPACRRRLHRDNASAMTAGHRRRRPENVCAATSLLPAAACGFRMALRIAEPAAVPTAAAPVVIVVIRVTRASAGEPALLVARGG